MKTLRDAFFWTNLYLFRLCLRYMDWAGFGCGDLIDDMERYYQSRKGRPAREALEGLARYWEPES
ncbi:MAG: hypothetical protein BWY09_02128 [Candidatus Hydrogenedentes bacterium ADurb.Bin179]|jgi:hypothetical protein|nr:MAG: hypothetical protein BWY09_02128 [Candidatus Hydrogenedentes bacterium ADurb.Bin179]